MAQLRGLRLTLLVGGHAQVDRLGRAPMTVVLDRVTRGRLRIDGVDPELRPLLAAALDPDPRRRPDEHEVLDALERYARHEDVTAALTRVHALVDPTRQAPQRPPAAPTSAPPAVAPPPRSFCTKATRSPPSRAWPATASSTPSRRLSARTTASSAASAPPA